MFEHFCCNPASVCCLARLQVTKDPPELVESKWLDVVLLLVAVAVVGVVVIGVVSVGVDLVMVSVVVVVG